MLIDEGCSGTSQSEKSIGEVVGGGGEGFAVNMDWREEVAAESKDMVRGKDGPEERVIGEYGAEVAALWEREVVAEVDSLTARKGRF